MTVVSYFDKSIYLGLFDKKDILRLTKGKHKTDGSKYLICRSMNWSVFIWWYVAGFKKNSSMRVSSDSEGYSMDLNH